MSRLKTSTLLIAQLFLVGITQEVVAESDMVTAIYIDSASMTWSEPKIMTVPGAQSSSQENNFFTSNQLTVSPSGWNTADVAVTTSTTTTQSENSVFISPTNPLILLNSNNSSDWPVSTIFGADYWVSTNGGQSWTGSVGGAGGTNKGDPATAIDLSGRFYIGYIAANRGQGVAYSTNQGVSWTHRQVAPGVTSPDLLDKNHLWVDNSVSSAYKGNLYSAWTRFQSSHPNNFDIEIARSIDGGINWGSPVNISNAVNAGSHNQGVNIQTGPNGEIYVVWSIYDCWPCNETAIGFAKSVDGGVTWSNASRIISNIGGHRLTALGGGKTMRHNSFPSMTVNQQSGKIYVVWTNLGVPGVNTGDPDIYMITSSSEGSTWSSPSRVNQDAQGNTKDQWFPWIACDPVTGLLACTYYDSRNFASNDRAETFVALSKNDGQTWTDFLVSDASWPGDGIAGFAGSYAGDYIAIASRENKLYPMWSDNRSGNMLVYVSPFEVGRKLRVPQTYATIQAAINAANDWDTVLVDPSFNPYIGSGNVNLTFGGKKILVTSSDTVSNVLVDCQSASRGFLFNSGETNESVLRYFTIRNGVHALYGGGMYIQSSPKIEFCVVENCSAWIGGGLIVTNSSAVSAPVIRFSTFKGNQATMADGGAVYLGANAQPVFGRVWFENNSAIDNGGAIYVGSEAGTSVNVNNSTFENNTAGGPGSAMYTEAIVNAFFCITVVKNNSTATRPSVFAIDGAADIVFDRVNIANNNTYAVDKISSNSTIRFVCDNFWQNTGGNFHPSSLYQQSNLNTGNDTGNIFVDPLFCDFANQIYNISWLSPLDYSNNDCVTSIGAHGVACGPAPLLVSPGNGTSTTNHSPLLDWTNVDSAGGFELRYQVEVDNNSDFSSVDRSASELTSSSWTVSPSLSDATWYWRARARNLIPLYNGSTLYQWGNWSAVWSLVVYTSGGGGGCPILFTNNGSNYIKEDALLTACEATGYKDVVIDYYHVKTVPSVNSNRVSFQLKEMADEVTYLEELQLLTVDHNVQTKVACEIKGGIFTYIEEDVSPLSAVDENGIDRLPEVMAEDGITFSSTRPGSLLLTFPNTGGGYEVNAAKKYIEKPTIPSEDPVVASLIAEYLNNNGEWIEIPAIPTRENDIRQVVLGAPEAINSETVSIRLSWSREYSTDVIRQIIPIDERPTIKSWPIGSFGISGNEASMKWTGFSESTPLVLRKGDIFDFSFDVGELNDQRTTRDYIIVAKGRYEPDEFGLLPNTIALFNNYPNPFNPSTTIAYNLPKADRVKLEIFNILGQSVVVLVDVHQEAGLHKVEWNSEAHNSLASGLYLYRLTVGDFVETKKMMLIK